MQSFVILDEENFVPETTEELQQFLAQEGLIHIVGLGIRPGVIEFIRTLELTHYQPRTRRNELFILRAIIWEELQWMVASIPSEDRVVAEEMADKAGLRIADGVPTLLTKPDKKKIFPMNNEQVFTLENKPDHPVYRKGIMHF